MQWNETVLFNKVCQNFKELTALIVLIAHYQVDRKCLIIYIPG